jgi:hypothetical protein
VVKKKKKKLAVLFPLTHAKISRLVNFLELGGLNLPTFVNKA